MRIDRMVGLLEKIASFRILHYVLALCLISSLFPFVENGKYISLAAMVVIASINKFRGRNYFLLLFWCWAMICSIINGIWGEREIAWTIVMLSATPMLGESRISLEVFKALFRLLPLFVCINLVAYIFDINYFYILYQEPNRFCFSGLTSHPQWLGAFTGLASVFTYYHAVIKKNGDRLRGVLAIVFFLMSVELGLLAGSRAALLSAAISIVLMTFLTCENVYDFLKRSSVVLVMLVFLMPIFFQSVEMIELKQLTQSYLGLSRRLLWENQIEIFKTNPFFGTGLIGGETGNGWLAVASKTGAIGVVLMIFIIISAVVKTIRTYSLDGDTLMPVCIFIYLLFHGCFEGYILTPGFLGCYIFWSCIGVLLSYNRRNKK